jgi:hypothetical protein
MDQANGFGRRDLLCAAAGTALGWTAIRAAAGETRPGGASAKTAENRLEEKGAVKAPSFVPRIPGSGKPDRCLFLDARHIGRLDGLELRPHAAKRYAGNPLMTKKHPWENARQQLYGSCIVHNEQKRLLQLFYLAMPGRSHYPNAKVGGVAKVGHVTLPAYAESKDGIHWERPLRPDVPFNDIAETNLLDLHRGQSFEAGVLWDPHDPNPQRRYKALVWDQEFNMPAPGKVEYARTPQGVMMRILDGSGNVVYEEPHVAPGMRISFSADGIYWRNEPGLVFNCSSDTANSVLYDPRLRRYVAFGRFNGTSPKYFSIGRGVARIESEDFIHWSHPEMVLIADEQDPDSLQINGMPVDIYEGIYIGLMEVDVRPQSHPALPLQLAVSRDGREWRRLANRFAFLEKPKEGAWDYSGGTGWVRPASRLVVTADEIWMYYSSGPSEMHEDSAHSDKWMVGMGLAKWRRDGFVSLHAGQEGGELLTTPFVVDGTEIHLNVDASDGQATVEVLNSQGKPIEGLKVGRPSEPVRGDHVDAAVRWPESDLAAWNGKPVTLRIRLRNADLYSLWTQESA